MSKTFGAVLLTLAICFGIALIVKGIVVDNEYETKIGGYVENAYWMNTPDRMLEQLNLAKDAMVSEGLNESDYGAVFFKRPDTSMVYQYQHWDSITERVKAVQIWYNNAYLKNGTQTENMGDVYEAKMDNLRKFIMEGTRSDDIAKSAWFIKNHIFIYWWWISALIIATLGIIGLAITFKDQLV